MFNCGIYLIRNTINGKVYVGSATNIKKRWSNGHINKLNRVKHENSYLQRAWIKYGGEAFAFSILENVAPENLLSREAYYVALYNATDRKHGYNIRPIDENGRVYCSQETKEKNRLAHIGKQHTELTKAKLRMIRLGPVVSDETRQKLSEAKKGVPKSQAAIDKHRQAICKTYYSLTNTETGEQFNGYNLQQFIRERGYTTGLYLVAQGKRNSYKGWQLSATLNN